MHIFLRNIPTLKLIYKIKDPLCSNITFPITCGKFEKFQNRKYTLFVHFFLSQNRFECHMSTKRSTMSLSSTEWMKCNTICCDSIIAVYNRLHIASIGTLSFLLSYTYDGIDWAKTCWCPVSAHWSTSQMVRQVIGPKVTLMAAKWMAAVTSHVNPNLNKMRLGSAANPEKHPAVEVLHIFFFKIWIIQEFKWPMFVFPINNK